MLLMIVIGYVMLLMPTQPLLFLSALITSCIAIRGLLRIILAALFTLLLAAWLALLLLTLSMLLRFLELFINLTMP